MPSLRYAELLMARPAHWPSAWRSVRGMSLAGFRWGIAFRSGWYFSGTASSSSGSQGDVGMDLKWRRGARSNGLSDGLVPLIWSMSVSRSAGPVDLLWKMPLWAISTCAGSR